MYRNGWTQEATCGVGQLNSWTHIAVVISSATQTCYINGTQSASFSYGTSSSIGNNYFVIGQWSNVISQATTYFGGEIDEVKIWSTDRSSNIQSDMQSYNPATSGLSAYYDFNEGSGSALIIRVPGASASTNLALIGSPIYVGVESSTVVNGDQVVTFPRTYLNSSGGWQIPSSVSTIRSLVVGGGGAGGAGGSRAGGGGGGANAGYTFGNGGGGGGGYSGSPDPIGGFGASGVVILRYPLNMSVTVSYSGGSTATYRTTGTITATTTLSGKVTFYDHGKAIPTCKNVATNGSNIATCTWKPSLHGATTLTATAKPSNTYVPNGSANLNLTVGARSTKR